MMQASHDCKSLTNSPAIVNAFSAPLSRWHCSSLRFIIPAYCMYQWSINKIIITLRAKPACQHSNRTLNKTSMPTQHTILPRCAVLRQIRWLECAKDKALCVMAETFLNIVALCRSQLHSNSVYQSLRTMYICKITVLCVYTTIAIIEQVY